LLNGLIDAALCYADLGYRVFPCLPGRKQPLTKNGLHDATIDQEQIERWWQAHPNANVAIATDGLLVVDIDTKENRWLADDHEKLLDLTAGPMSLTANGGQQHFFRQPKDKHWRNTAGQLAPQVDTRADGGYVVAPPSVLTGARRYRWAQALDEPPERLPLPPSWLIEQLDRLARGTNPSERIALNNGDTNKIPSGQRNHALASLAGTMRRVGMTTTEMRAALLQANQDRCVPPLPEVEIDRLVQSIGRYQPDQVSVAITENHWEQTFAKKPLQFTAISSAELDENDYQLSYLIDGILVRGQPGVIAGPKKTLKTNLSIELALSLSHAGLFLGRFNVNQPVRVGLMSGESGAATIQETARRIADAKGRRLADFQNVVWSFEVPQLGNAEHIDALRDLIARHELEVLILDPTYLMMLGLGDNAGNLFIVGSFLKSLGELAQETGCTPLLCHHLKKGIADPYEPAELDNIAWAGFQEFVRQWVLLNRRVRYDPDRGGYHELWMSVGGSAGHSGLWGLNIEEGTRQDPGSRRWDVEVMSASEAYEQRTRVKEMATAVENELKRESQTKRDRCATLTALKKFPSGETARSIREAAGLSGQRFRPIVDELVEEGLVRECEVTKSNGQKYAGFQLTGISGTEWDYPGVPVG